MSKVDEFEKAIKKFGVGAALEYFATPTESHKDFEFLQSEFDIGDKVVPHKKTAGENPGLKYSITWDDAKKKGQPFLYVTETPDSSQSYYCLSDDMDDGGDFFKPGDFILYQK